VNGHSIGWQVSQIELERVPIPEKSTMPWQRPIIAISLTLALVNVGSANETELATWALSKAPVVTISVKGQEREVWKRSELPNSDFQITAVSFSGVNGTFNEPIFDQLAKMSSLAELDFSHTNISDANLKRLSTFVQLKRLFLSNCTSISDEGIEHIKTMPRLTELRLHSTDITDGAIESLVELPSLTILVLNGTDVTDAGIARLGKKSSLTELHLYYTKITDEGLTHLAQLENLKHLNLGVCELLTKRAVKRLRKQLPQCKIEYSKDLPRLKE
jgi:Leucine-rich repeat (LRR) protein